MAKENQAEATGRERLVRRLNDLGIVAPTVPYPAARTVEDAKELRGTMPGAFTKNLLLRDKKERLFLFSIAEDRRLDLATIHRKVGASGRLGFAHVERMREALQVEPGALTPWASSTTKKAWSRPLSMLPFSTRCR
jgi:Ala-tRNA(Pro) deacylase